MGLPYKAFVDVGVGQAVSWNLPHTPQGLYDTYTTIGGKTRHADVMDFYMDEIHICICISVIFTHGWYIKGIVALDLISAINWAQRLKGFSIR
jgi:hypothetical protein